MKNATRNLSMAGAALALVLTGSGKASAQPGDSNRMDLAEFYSIWVGDSQARVEARCECTGVRLDRWHSANGRLHKRIAYQDNPGLNFRVDYRRTNAGVWTVRDKSIEADGFVFPFRSDRNS